MKINQEQVKSLLKAMDYLPEDGVNNIYYSSIRKLNKQKARMAIQTILCLVMQFLNVFQRFCVVRHAKTAFFFAKKGLSQTILLICDSPISPRILR